LHLGIPYHVRDELLNSLQKRLFQQVAKGEGKMSTQEWIDLSDRYIMSTYKRFPVVLTRGLGVHVWDSDGRCYLDLVAGIAVCALGHAHPAVVAAIKEQAENLFHVSNLYHIAPQILLARLLVENSPFDKVFFCNSGAEANEAAIKLARKYASEHMQGRYELITMQDSFHGRTLATVTATAQQRFHVGFAPLPEGFRYVPYNDLPALEAAVTEKTCGVLVEPIQGESGVVIPAPRYLQGIRRICDERGLLMIADEVQTGIGRTGTLFACEHDDVIPDMITLAKALGNGFPIGALLAKEKIAAAFVPGSHGSTFGGNPLACAAAMATLETILEDGILENCRKVGEYFLSRLGELQGKHTRIREVRGRGLILAVELTVPGAEFVLKCMEKGLLINCTNGNVLRFVPPLILTRQDVDKAVAILDEVLEEK
jgi:acetylornithine/N-succinyldiaminopimelate aminotransferase